MRRSSWLLALAFGCNQVERLPVDADRRVPPDVQAVFDASCNGRPGCHSDNAGGVEFSPEGGYIGRAGNGGLPIVEPGDPFGSLVMVRIDAGEMPPPGTLELSAGDRFVLLGWIADGAPLVGGADEGGSSSSDDTGDASESSGSTETGPAPTYDEFVPVLDVFRANCGGPACHRDGGSQIPRLDDAVAYDNIVDVAAGGAPDGFPYVTPGDPAQSHLVRRITAADGFTPMPPAPAEPLSQADIDVVVNWIEAGANL